MTLLQTYHKQRISKKAMNELFQLKRQFQFDYPDNLKYTLKLILIHNSIAQKDIFENSFESFRNTHLDMWDNLNFQERNKLFQLDFEPTRNMLNHFDFEGERIYIPVFDILFNNLYDRETAILELPQYFKLHHEFKENIIDVDTYGLLPYKASMCYPCLASCKSSAILFDDRLNTFYRVNDQVEFYPLLKSSKISSEDAHVLARHLSEFNDAAFLQLAMDQGYVHPKLVKKVERLRR